MVYAPSNSQGFTGNKLKSKYQPLPQKNDGGLKETLLERWWGGEVVKGIAARGIRSRIIYFVKNI